MGGMKFLVALIGLFLVLEGMPYLVFPEAMRKWLRQIAAAPAGQLRFMGLLAMIFGLLLCFITQRTNLFG